MQRFVVLTYGVVVYLFFFWTILYAIGFTTDLVVPRAIDDAPMSSGWIGWVINIGLLSLFAVQHSIMARRGFKAKLTEFIPPAAERSTYVLLTCVILNLLFWQWQAIPSVIWSTDNQIAIWALTGLSLVGWGIVFLATFLINHFELFGLSQVWRNFRGTQPAPKKFVTPMLYRISRHPLYLGFIIAFWATPVMTVGHLLFAAITTIYMVFAVVVFEEPDLVRDFSEEYPRYQRTVRMLLPIPKRSKDDAKPETVTA